MTEPITRLNAALEGRYHIKRELGEGGMATVYLAHDERHNRNVALKVLKAELAAVVGAERFLAEIETTAKLTHPHILPLHDSGEADGFLFFVTPYIEGDTLRDKIDREKQLSIEEALKITEDVAEALDHAHRHGVVHRDIKPANILLTDGRPLIADFGIALAVAQAGGGRITETGLSVGTPHYMSPEQATGDRDVDPRTDVYALGCVLYEMLVGDPPYQGTTAQAVLAKILTSDAPAPTDVRVSISPNVDAAIRKALEKLPADRFRAAQEFARALDDPGFRHGEAAAAGVGAARGMWNPLSMAVTGVALVLALALGWALLRPEPPQPVSRQYLNTEGWSGLNVPLGQLVALAPDGSSMVVPVQLAEGGWQLGLKMRGSTEIAPIPDTEQGMEPTYSPDGQWIAYRVGAEILKRPLVGGSSVTLAEDGNPSGTSAFSWLDDGTMLYEWEDTGQASPRGILRISEDGGKPLDVVYRPELPYAPSWVQGLPGSQGAVVIGCPGPTTCSGDRAELRIVDLEDLSSEIALEQVVRAWYAPTGHIVYVRLDGAVFAAPFDLGALQISGSGVPLFDDVRVSGDRADIVLGSDGTLLYVEGSSLGATAVQRLLVVDLEGNEEALPLDSRAIGRVRWSPDGQSVAYSLNQSTATPHDFYTYNVTLGTTPRQLTFEGANQWGVFSPDGNRIAFSSARDGTDSYEVKSLDDDSPVRLSRCREPKSRPSGSDTLIVFESGGGPANRDLWTLNLSDPDNPRAEAYLSSEAAFFNQSLRDGTLAAYHSNESGANEVCIRASPIPASEHQCRKVKGWPLLVTRWEHSVLLEKREPRRIDLHGRSHPATATPVVLSRDSLFTREMVLSGGGNVVAYDLNAEGDRFIVAQTATARTLARVPPSHSDSSSSRTSSRS